MPVRHRAGRTVGSTPARLSQGPIPDQRGLHIVDQAQTLVTVPQRLLEEGEQQPVALGRASVERTEVRPWADNSDPGDPEAQTIHRGRRSPNPRIDTTRFQRELAHPPGWLPKGSRTSGGRSN